MNERPSTTPTYVVIWNRDADQGPTMLNRAIGTRDLVEPTFYAQTTNKRVRVEWPDGFTPGRPTASGIDNPLCLVTPEAVQSWADDLNGVVELAEQLAAERDRYKAALESVVRGQDWDDCVEIATAALAGPAVTG